jgi:hypothetical protein
MTELRAITHEFLPGLKVTCRMEGDTFEMEDQRNWTDASYKTYVRPLALPWPYVIGKGDAIDQTITLTVSGSAGRIESADRALSLAIGQRVTGSFMPPLGIGGICCAFCDRRSIRYYARSRCWGFRDRIRKGRLPATLVRREWRNLSGVPCDQRSRRAARPTAR